MERLFLDVINWSVCRYSLVCVSARAFLQFPNISTGDLICRFQSSSAKNIELTFQPSAGKVTELCLQLALTRGPWLICVDKAARRSPPSLPPPPSRTPSCVVNNSKCQSQADVTCAFLKKKNLSPLLCVTGRVPYMGKKPGRERWPYVAREGSVFPAEELQNVVHARYARHVHRLCACRTIKQRSSLCPEVKQYPDPR